MLPPFFTDFLTNNNDKMATFANVSNGAKAIIDQSRPYVAEVEVTGTAKMLMHCWNIESIEEKAKAKKNSTKKKTDDLESYVLRNDAGQIVMPTLNFCAAIREAGKSFADPTSPRKSMKDRLKAVIIPEQEFGLLNDGTTEWDFVDRRRVVIQRAGITRERPGFYEGWKITFRLVVLEPEYLQPEKLHELIDNAGKFQALGDFRPTFGRFRISRFEVMNWD